MENTIQSPDGTKISYYSKGEGPGLIIVPGNNRMAHNYDKLISFLEGNFLVHTIERRGRGNSGPQGSEYTIEREVEDLLAVMTATKSKYVFGHSYGGLIALQASLRTTEINKLTVYEPGVSINGSIDTKWLPEFTELVRENRQSSAMALFLNETKLSPISELPVPLLKAFSYILLGGKSGGEMRAMMATTPNEILEITRLDSSGERYKQVQPQTLLLGGTKSPRYLTNVLPMLSTFILRSHYKILSGLDHNAPDLNAPKIIADELRIFLEKE